ncbi:hypothetical protein A6R68_09179 [Neotoma lepida]|uniref:Peptidase S1 domain-containing protein n=1 Tax=Neotoma lepida TaxID=56216 RepID=A0A1A6G2U6_NEOLE|nr:hypothetical protein A6R68_09179 [Neotoma lepida]
MTTLEIMQALGVIVVCGERVKKMESAQTLSRGLELIADVKRGGKYYQRHSETPTVNPPPPTQMLVTEWVLTAAHCIYSRIQYNVKMGDRSVYRQNTSLGKKKHQASVAFSQASGLPAKAHPWVKEWWGREWWYGGRGLGVHSDLGVNTKELEKEDMSCDRGLEDIAQALASLIQGGQ